jgi:hypothetical protein
MVATRTRLLLILPQETVDRARVLAGQAMTALKMPVSLQIVLRALIEEGLARRQPALSANIERQARAVREIRSVARRRAPAGPAPRAARWETGRPGGRRHRPPRRERGPARKRRRS